MLIQSKNSLSLLISFGWKNRILNLPWKKWKSPTSHWPLFTLEVCPPPPLPPFRLILFGAVKPCHTHDITICQLDSRARAILHWMMMILNTHQLRRLGQLANLLLYSRNAINILYHHLECDATTGMDLPPAGQRGAAIEEWMALWVVVHKLLLRIRS